VTTERTVVRFRQIKKKAVQFKCGRLPANNRDLAFICAFTLSHPQCDSMLCDFLSTGFLLC
jgi:hypothetical protein